MRVNQNITAFNAYRNLSASNTTMSKTMEKLSSGTRINRAGDDASGLVISQGLRAQVGGLRQASRNAQDGISVVQTAEGALNEVHNMLGRMRDLAVQASNSGAGDQKARDAAQKEVAQLQQEIDKTASETKFGTTALLDGSYGVNPATVTGTVTGAKTWGATDDFDLTVDGNATVTVNLAAFSGSDSAAATQLETDIKAALTASADAGNKALANNVKVSVAGTGGLKIDIGGLAATKTFVLADNTAAAGNGLTAIGLGAVTAAAGTGGTFQVGANAGETIDVNIGAMSASALSVDVANVDLTSASGASSAIAKIDAAISSVSTTRGDLGAKQNRFESRIANLNVATENLSASESRIRDTDYAMEMVSFTRGQIMSQVGTSMLGQANSLPQGVLSLLRG